MKKKMNQILSGLNEISIYGEKKTLIDGIVNDSRKVQKNFIYVAIIGNDLDGHDFIDQAIENGASVVICSKSPDKIDKKITYILVKNTKKAQGIVASNFYNNPSNRINVIMVTGTNGKTTVVSLFYSLFMSMNIKVGMLTTIENKINDKTYTSKLTTPDSIELNYYLNKMVDHKCKYCFMEASSHAIDQLRIYGIKIKAGIFTNISHDHLDYHLNFKNYIDSKKKLFDLLDEKSIALVNNDDKRSNYILQNCFATKYYYGIKKDSEFSTKIINNSIEGLKLKIDNQDIFVKLKGKFNAYNILCVYAGSIILGIKKSNLLKYISRLESPKGRFELIKNRIGPSILIDYAHTPDALENVLKTIKEFKIKGKIISLFGAGGNRDKKKRFFMGEIASKYSDKIVLTTDNPRNEDPLNIINDIKLGIKNKKKLIINVDRKSAIKSTIFNAQSNDIILIAGKGHEDYQEIKEIKYPFDDKLVINRILNLMKT